MFYQLQAISLIWVYFFSSFLEVLASNSEAGTLILGGFLISTKVIEPVYGLVIVYSGVLIGDYLFYSIGRSMVV